MKMTRIESLSDPRVADYANLRDAELLQREEPLNPAGHRGLFIAEGELVVRRLLESRYRTRSLFLAESRLASMADAIERLPAETQVLVAPQPLFNEIVGFNIHRGALAIGERGEPQSLSKLLARRGPFLILEDLCNHDNLGSIFRNVAALGGTEAVVLLSPRAADPLYRKCIRVSMGNVLSVPFVRLADFPDPNGRDAHALRAAGIKLWAMTPADDALSITRTVAVHAKSESATAKRIAMMFGSEGPGLTRAAIALADQRVVIPMQKAHAEVDSLNVGVASAVALFALQNATP